MILIHRRFYGTCDQLPGGAHVATQFLCMSFIPLVPEQSALVFGPSANSSRAAMVRVPFSWKSVAYGYARAALALAAACLVIAGLAKFEDGDTAAAAACWAGAAATAALLPVSFWLSRPSPERAARLARLGGPSVDSPYSDPY